MAGMTRDQAMRELERICDVFERKPENLRPRQLNEWLNALQRFSYERGRHTMTHLIQTWSSSWFPPPGALDKAAKESSFEGQPNAGAYSQDGGDPSHDPKQVAAQLEQYDELIAMTDEEYNEWLQNKLASGWNPLRRTG